MKRRLFVALAVVPVFASLTACPGPLDTTPAPATVAAAVNGAIIAETGARGRCPRTPGEWQVLGGIRLAFDLRYGSAMTPEQGQALGAARVETNRYCGAS